MNASRLASYEADADIVADPAFKNLVNLISGLPWDRGERLSFRGVPDKLVPHDCGPAPTSKVGHGRYNRIGVAMLYLSDSLDGMYLEVGEKSLLVQKFRVPFATMKIAAVSQLPNEHDVNQALFYAELRERDATLNPDDPGGYRFSQLLSDEFQKRFDGMIVRSAKGPFCNIVIFKPDPRWSEWTMGAPRLVAAP